MTDSNTRNNVFTSVANLPESLDQGIKKYGIKPRPATPDQINADKEKIRNWFKSINNPARQLNAYQQLETGHVYPYAYLPENKYFVALINRFLMINQISNLDSNKFTSESLVKKFETIQDQKYINLNEQVNTIILNCRTSIQDRHNFNNQNNVIDKFIAAVLNIKLSETSPYTDLHNGIKKLLESDKYRELNKRLTAGDIDAIKKLRHDVYAMHDQVDFELRKLKIDINRYIVAENKSQSAGSDGQSPLLCLVNRSKAKKLFSASPVQAAPSAPSASSSKSSDSDEYNPFEFKSKYKAGTLSPEKIKRKAEIRKQKEQNKQIAQVTSQAVGVGEGTVPAYVAYSVFNPMLGAPLAITAALSAFASGYWFNKFLVQADTENVLKSLRLNDMLNNMGSVADDYEFEFTRNNESHASAQNPGKKVIVRYLYTTKPGEISYSYSASLSDADNTTISIPKALMSDIAKRLGYGDNELDKFNTDVFGDENNTVDNLPTNDQQEAFRRSQRSQADLRRHVREALIGYLCEQKIIDGHNERMVKKDIAVILGSLCLSTGLVYGALSAMSIYAGVLTPVLTALHAGFIASLLGASVLAFPVTLTMIGMAAVYFIIIATLISRNQWHNAKDYLKENFIHVFYKRRGKKLPFALLKAFMNFLRIFTILAVTVVLAVMSFFLFSGSVDQAISTAFAFFKASDRFIMSLVIAAMNFIVSMPFSFKKLNDLLTIKNVIKSLIYLPASAIHLAWTLLAGAVIFGVVKLSYFVLKSLSQLLVFLMDQLKNFKFLSSVAMILIFAVKAVVGLIAGLSKLPLFVLKFLIAGVCDIFKGNYGQVSLWIERNLIKNLVDVPAKYIVAGLSWVISVTFKSLQFGLVGFFSLIKLNRLIDAVINKLTSQKPSDEKNIEDKFLDFVNLLKCSAFYVNLRLYNLRPGAKMPETSEEFFQQASAIYRLMMIVGILPNSGLQGVMFGRNTPNIVAMAGAPVAGTFKTFLVAMSSYLATENSKSGNLAAAGEQMKAQLPLESSQAASSFNLLSRIVSVFKLSSKAGFRESLISRIDSESTSAA